MTSKNSEEREMAELAKKYIQDRIEYKFVELQNVKLDKYGRLLAEVFCNGDNINQELIDKHLAVEYDGGTKKPPSSWKNTMKNVINYKEPWHIEYSNRLLKYIINGPNNINQSHTKSYFTLKQEIKRLKCCDDH